MSGLEHARALERLRVTARESLVPGATAGLVGGVAFGLARLELGMLPSVASLVRTDSEIVGLLVHIIIAAAMGAGLGYFLRGRWTAGDTVLWGVTYAAFFWFLGPLTLMPLILGEVPAWDISTAQAAFPSLLGHIVWGTVTALALVTIKTGMAVSSTHAGQVADARAPERHPPSPALPARLRAWALRVRGGHSWPTRSVIIRGLAAGLAGFVMISLIPVGQERMISVLGDAGMAGSAWLGPLVMAMTWSLLFAMAHPVSTPTSGAAVVRGAGFGTLLWVVGGLTLLPLLRGDGLDWAIPDAQAAFPALLGSVLFASATAIAYHWLTRLTPILFSDDDPVAPPDAGAWGLRAVLRGGAAGLVGGLLFTMVMVAIGYLPIVASLIGSGSELVGLVVHLAIAITIGASYGVLFRRQAFDAGAAIGWGVSYGFVWWILGPLTLAPIILGSDPAWTVEGAAAAFPSLIGHLAYGAGLGITFYVLEGRYTPWWISRSESEAQRMAGRRIMAGSAGPALWALLVLVAVLMPTVLAAPDEGGLQVPGATGALFDSWLGRQDRPEPSASVASRVG